jgi:hypothetical protein
MVRAYKNPGTIVFTALITSNTSINNSSAFIAFPYDLKEMFGVGNLVPCKAVFDNRIAYQGSLAKMGDEHAVLLLRKDVQEQLGKDPGEYVTVEISLDDSPRKVTVDSDMHEVLKRKKLWDTFQTLAYSHQKEYVVWINAAKQLTTRERRLDKMCAKLNQTKKNLS